MSFRKILAAVQAPLSTQDFKTLLSDFIRKTPKKFHKAPILWFKRPITSQTIEESSEKDLKHLCEEIIKTTESRKAFIEHGNLRLVLEILDKSGSKLFVKNEWLSKLLDSKIKKKENNEALEVLQALAKITLPQKLPELIASTIHQAIKEHLAPLALSILQHYPDLFTKENSNSIVSLLAFSINKGHTELALHAQQKISTVLLSNINDTPYLNDMIQQLNGIQSDTNKSTVLDHMAIIFTEVINKAIDVKNIKAVAEIFSSLPPVIMNRLLQSHDVHWGKAFISAATYYVENQGDKVEAVRAVSIAAYIASRSPKGIDTSIFIDIINFWNAHQPQLIALLDSICTILDRITPNTEKYQETLELVVGHNNCTATLKIYRLLGNKPLDEAFQLRLLTTASRQDALLFHEVLRRTSPQLLDKPDEKGNTVLHRLIIEGDPHYAASIIEKMNINTIGDKPNIDGNTTLHLASIRVGNILGTLEHPQDRPTSIEHLTKAIRCLVKTSPLDLPNNEGKTARSLLAALNETYTLNIDVPEKGTWDTFVDWVSSKIQ